MKRLAILLAVSALLGPPALAQKTLYFCPDVPTDDPGGSGTIFLPWQCFGYKGGLYSTTAALSLPPSVAIDAVHKMDDPGHWLFSVEAPVELPPGSGVICSAPSKVDVYEYQVSSPSPVRNPSPHDA